MPIARFAAAALVALLPSLAPLTSPLAAQDTPPLRVIRTAPSAQTASALSQIAVTFDRPVAGSLDRVVDPATVMRIEPSIAGKFEWRDPVTVRFIPVAPLTAGATYQVVVSNTFRSMDGGALADLSIDISRARTHAHRRPPVARARGSAADHAEPAIPARLQLDGRSPPRRGGLVLRIQCRVQQPANLPYVRDCRARVTDKDRWELREAGGGGRDRRLIHCAGLSFAPDSLLPHGCSGEFVAPIEDDAAMSRGFARQLVKTYGDLRLLQSTAPRTRRARADH